MSVCSFSSWPHVGIGAAGAAQRVEFVDEDDRRRLLARLLEQIAHPRRADADEHFDEFRAVDREERHAGLAGHRAREQRLAGARRPDQQDALRHRARPAGHIRAGCFEKVDDFLELLLGLVDARHVLERRLGVGLDIDLRLAAPDRHQPANAALALRDAPEPEVPNAEEHQCGKDPRQQRADEGVLHLAAEPHVVLFEFVGKLRRDARGHEALGAVLLRFLPVALDIVARNADLGDLAAFQVVEKLAVRNRNDVLAEAP